MVWQFETNRPRVWKGVGFWREAGSALLDEDVPVSSTEAALGASGCGSRVSSDLGFRG